MIEDHRLSIALDQYGRGQYHQALELIREMLGEQPEEGELHALLAACLLQLNRPVGAEYEIGIALGQSPGLPFAHLISAQILLFKRKLGEAVEACDEALRLDPELVDAHLQKAQLYQLQDQRTQAEACLRQAVSLAPTSVAVLVALGRLEQGQGNHLGAAEYAERALAIDAGAESANVLMGEAKLALGDTDDADYHAKMAIMQNPASDSALSLFVDIRMRRNWFMGLWWRINSWMSGLTNNGMAIALIVAYLVFNLSAQILKDLGATSAGTIVGLGWLAVAAYSWFGIPVYKRALEKELSEFQFNSKF